MTRWEQNERARADLLAAFYEAESNLENGRFVDYTGSDMENLAGDLKREARALRDTRRF